MKAGVAGEQRAESPNQTSDDSLLLALSNTGHI